MRLEIEGKEIQVREAGAGPPLVLVHGYPFDGAMWSAVARALAGRFRVLKPDLPGRGDNPSPPRTAMRELGDFLETLLAGLPDPAGVAGFSMGGYVLLELAKRRPANLSAMALVDTRAVGDDDETRRKRDETIEMLGRDGVGSVAEMMLGRVLAPASLANRELVERVRRIILRQPATALAADVAAMRDRPDSSAFLGEIRVPTLALVGEHDAISSPAECRRMAEAIPGARLEIVPGAGHLTPMEQPRAVAEALGGFFGSVLRPAS